MKFGTAGCFDIVDADTNARINSVYWVVDGKANSLTLSPTLGFYATQVAPDSDQILPYGTIGTVDIRYAGGTMRPLGGNPNALKHNNPVPLQDRNE